MESDQLKEKQEQYREKLISRAEVRLRELERNKKKLPNVEKLLKQGRTLLEDINELSEGMKKYKGIALHPKLNPKGNIDRVFEKVREGKTLGPQYELEFEQITAIHEKLTAGEEVPENAHEIIKRKKPFQFPRKCYRIFKSIDDQEIFVGKGGADNDKLSIQVAKAGDLFLHALGAPGSHVIIPKPENDFVTEDTIMDASHLALYFSKLLNCKTAEVSLADAGDVSKPGNAKPGLVHVNDRRVVKVYRDVDRLVRLLSGDVF